jgi:hypothetical protein
MLCTTGVGTIKQREPVAFRLEATDRGEPGRGDTYRLRIWRASSVTEAEMLAQLVCCTNAQPLPAAGPPDIDDGGVNGAPLRSGNLQIHRELKKSEDGICPPPAKGSVCE